MQISTAEDMTGRRLLPCLLTICLFRVSDALECHAKCLLFGSKETAIVFEQQNSTNGGDPGFGDASSTNRLLSLHNAAREGVAAGTLWAPAANMRLMEWDEKLENWAYESLALWLSTSCSLSPERCYWSDIPGNLSNNYGMIGGPGYTPDPSDVFNSWTNLNSSLGLDNPKFWSTFSNVMDAENSKIGCGETVLKERGLHARFLLCYYQPGSNYDPNTQFNVSQIYEVGQPCSKCPTGTACNVSSLYPSLCATIDIPTPTSDGIQNFPSPFTILLLAMTFNWANWSR